MIRSRHPLWWPGKTDVLHAAQNESWRFTGAGREEKGRSMMDLLAAWCPGVLMIVSHSLAPGSKRGSSDPRLKWKPSWFISVLRWDVLQAVAVVAVQDVGGHGPKCKRNKPSNVMFRCISLHTRKSRDGQEDQEGRWRDQRFIDFVVAGRCLKPEAIRCW